MESIMTPLVMLAQANEAVTNAAAESSEAVTTLADWIVRGDLMMIPIIAGSVIALAIIIERFVYLRRVRLETGQFMMQIMRTLTAGRLAEGLRACERSQLPIANIIRAGIENTHKKEEQIKQAIETAAEREVPRLERFLPALGTIAHVSPLLGLLGTVFGMIQSTDAMARQGVNLALEGGLIGGISVALITTAAGLVVAIPTLILYNYFVNKVNTIVLDMEVHSSDVVALLGSQNGKKPGKAAVLDASYE
jgi:biopolymer transport protein ExbB